MFASVRWRPTGAGMFRAGIILLILGITRFYSRAVSFGFFWDDPTWFGHVIDKGWLELIRPTADFHFYRPAALLYIRLFQLANGTFAAVPLHWLQLCWHALNIALIGTIGRSLRLKRSHAIIAAVLFATHPFAYQAIAWAAPQQPVATALQLGALLFYLQSRAKTAQATPIACLPGEVAFRPVTYVFSLILFFFALAMQESTFPLAVLPLLFEFPKAAWRRPPMMPGTQPPVALRRGWQTSLAYPAIALAYLLYWLQTPRFPGVIGLQFDRRVLSYLLQGIVYPFFGRPAGWDPSSMPGFNAVLLLSLGATALLLAHSRVGKRLSLGLLGVVWASLSLTPSIFGLPYAYVRLGPRLLYAAAPAIALFWVASLHPFLDSKLRSRKLVGVLVVLLIAGQSGMLLQRMHQLYLQSTGHLADAIEAMSSEPGPFLFVNFPDQLSQRRPPYPRGYWGVPLAPASVDLHRFPRLSGDIDVTSRSVAVPWIDTEPRSTGEYQVALRGRIVPADELYRLAAAHPTLLLSRYSDGGQFRLEKAGSLQPGGAGDCELAWFAGVVCLHRVTIERDGERWHVSLAWSTQESLPPHLTIFVHLGIPGTVPVAQEDGDTWRGMLPLTMWQPGDLVIDERWLPRLSESADLLLRLGLYNRLTGERQTGIAADGSPLEGDAFALPLPGP